MRAAARTHVRVYVRLKKDHEGGGDAEVAEERGPNRAYVCAARCACARVFEEKHISLLLLPPSLFFLPADLHSRWVGLLLLPVCLFLSLFSQRVSLSLASSPLLSSSEQRERFNPERALFPFYARIATRNCVARPAARERAEETERIY